MIRAENRESCRYGYRRMGRKAGVQGSKERRWKARQVPRGGWSSKGEGEDRVERGDAVEESLPHR